jgi:hypothetical protein
MPADTADDAAQRRAESEDPAEAARRLEAAIERIAEVAKRASVAIPSTPDTTTRELSARLDSLIVKVRDALGIR